THTHCLSLSRLPPRSTLFPYTTLFRSAHPAFSKMFVETDISGDDGATIFAERRQRSSGDPTIALAHFVTSTAGVTRDVQAETDRSEEHTSELQSRENLVCRLLLEKKKK